MTTVVEALVKYNHILADGKSHRPAEVGASIYDSNPGMVRIRHKTPTGKTDSLSMPRDVFNALIDMLHELDNSVEREYEQVKKHNKVRSHGIMTIDI